MSSIPSPAEVLNRLQNHPLIKQVTDDIASSRAQLQTQRLLEEADAQRERHEVVTSLQNQYQTALEDYERLRLELHESVGRIWAAVDAYTRLTGGHPPPEFAAQMFNDINVPTLRPIRSPWGNPNALTTTTRAAVEGWQATHGQTWPIYVCAPREEVT